MNAERSEQMRTQDDGCTPKKQDKSQITLPRSGKIIDQITEKKSAIQQTYGKHTIKLEKELETWRQKPFEIRRILQYSVHETLQEIPEQEESGSYTFELNLFI